MEIIPIASFGIGNEAHKFRLIDIDTMKVSDIPAWRVKKAIEKNLLTINNMKISNNKLRGVRWSLNRLPTLNSDYELLEEGYTVLFQVKDMNAYIICNHLGKFTAATMNEVIGLSLVSKISNGDIVKRGYETKLNGKYREFEVDESTIDKLNKYDRDKTNINNKLSLLGYKYRIYGDTIRLINEDVTELDIIKPVKRLGEELYKARKLTKLRLPNTLESLDLRLLFSSNRLETVELSRSTKMKKVGNKILKRHVDSILKYYD